MTENDYLSWTRPAALLKCLSARTTPAQYALFLCAVWRRQAEGAEDHQTLRAVGTLERHVLGEAAIEELIPELPNLPLPQIDSLLNAVGGIPEYTIIAQLGQGQVGLRANAEKLAQANLLRCIVGNPYTPAGVDPAWLRWNGGEIPRMAEAIHRARRFDELPVLADALEEAGCGDSDILGHCRTRREHALGCWLLSLLRSRLAVRLILSTPEVRLSGWRPDTAEVENVSAEAVTIAYYQHPLEMLGLLTLDEAGEVADYQPTLFAAAYARTRTVALGPGGVLRHPLGPTRSLKPGIYTMQALFRHGGIDLRSRAFLFTVPTEA